MRQATHNTDTDDSGFPSPRMRQRVMVRAYRTFASAERAVEALVEDGGIGRERITLLAREPRRENRDTVGTVYRGSQVGALVGAACGLALYLLGITDGESALLPIVAAALAGAVAGAALSLVLGADDTLRFAHYDVLVDEEVVGSARRELSRGTG